LSSYRSFARLIWRSARWQVVAAIALSMLLSLTEGISLVMVFPLIALLGDPAQPASAANAGPRTRLLFHLLTLSHIPRGAWLGTILVVVLISVGMLTQLNGMLSTLTVSIVLPLRRNLAAQIYQAVLHADWSFLTRRKSSDITHLLSAELGRVSTVTSNVLALISNAMVGLLMLGLACFYAPLLTLAVLVCFGLLVPWQRRSSRDIYRSGIEISVRMRQVFESSAERLQNLKVVKAYGAQEAEQDLFVGRYDQLIAEQIENQWLNVASSRRFQMVSLVLLCALILVGLDTLHLSAPAMLVFLFAFVRATPRVNTVQSKANEIFTDLPAYTHIQDFLVECAEHSEAGDIDAPAPELQSELVLRNVSFGYVPGAPPVLDGIDLVFPAGSITAVAGLSGAGKSTVADLVMGLLLPDSGVVASDGVAITRTNARAWRGRIGYVSQDTLLFHDTIRANLLWARPSATEEQLAEAIAAASAQFVFALPHRQDTIVGDRGVMLSHGQRQRIALARALLLQPSLLILDEATNSLDLENEQNILDVVRALGVTTILISHRPSTVRIADRVYLLEAGRVTRSGSWDEVRAAVEAGQA
jgi:ATP-binding cassette subfamily C protein